MGGGSHGPDYLVFIGPGKEWVFALSSKGIHSRLLGSEWQDLCFPNITLRLCEEQTVSEEEWVREAELEAYCSIPGWGGRWLGAEGR